MQSKYYAGFFVRLAAYLIDILILNIGFLPVRVIGLFSKVSFLFTKNLFFSFSWWSVISIAITWVYFILLTYFNGQTLGKMLLKIKVVGANEQTPSIVDIIVRETVGKFLSRVVIYIGFIMIGVDSNKRGLHDIICDTLVVYDYTASSNENDIDNDTETFDLSKEAKIEDTIDEFN